MNNVNIKINTREHTCYIFAEVSSSAEASLLADRLDALDYLKVIERKYPYPMAEIHCRTFIKFNIEKLHTDLEKALIF